MYKNFVKNYFIVILIFSFVFVLPSMITMWRFYEYSDGDRIVNDQQSSHGIFSSSLDNNAMPYKLSLIKSRNPTVVAIGSSRAMQFREEFFNDNVIFVNAGGSASSIEDMVKFSTAVVENNPPELLILTIDFWWFNKNRNNPKRPLEGTLSSFDLKKAIHFWNILISDGLPNVSGLINTTPMKSDISGLNVLGLSASYSSSGYRPDGSRLYYDLVFGDREGTDPRFSNTIKRVEEGNQRFEYGTEIDLDAIKNFLSLVKYLKDQEIEVAVLLPPVAPDVIDAMESKGDSYDFLYELIDISEDMGFYNYHNPEKLNSNKCEFIDGFHGGDVLYHRILLAMAESSEHIRPYISIDRSKEMISRHSGKTYTKTNTHKVLNQMQERDFLEIGCQK